MPRRPDEQRREELLEQLESLVLAEGFAHLRVGSLASRLRCSRSSLYKLAHSKDALIELVFERYVRRAIDDADERASRKSSAAARIMEFARVIDEWQAKGSSEFWRDVRDNPQTADVLSLSRGRGYRIIQGYLDEGVANGEFRPANTAFAARMVWMGAGITRDPDVLEELGISRQTASEELLQLILYGMGPIRE